MRGGEVSFVNILRHLQGSEFKAVLLFCHDVLLTAAGIKYPLR